MFRNITNKRRVWHKFVLLISGYASLCVLRMEGINSRSGEVPVAHYTDLMNARIVMAS